MITVDAVIAAANRFPADVSGAAARTQLRVDVLDGQLQHHQVDDARCTQRFTTLGFITHTATVQHMAGEVTAVDVERDERDLGRQGESRTAARS